MYCLMHMKVVALLLSLYANRFHQASKSAFCFLELFTRVYLGVNPSPCFPLLVFYVKSARVALKWLLDLQWMLMYGANLIVGGIECLALSLKISPFIFCIHFFVFLSVR